jgi:hypothetical protein
MLKNWSVAMSGPEASIERSACRWAKTALGIENTKLSPQGSTGWPDRLFWLPHGHVLLIEFKRPNMNPGRLQSQIHRYLRSLGHWVETADDLTQAKEIIEGYLILATGEDHGKKTFD